MKALTGDIQDLEIYLRQKGWIDKDEEVISAEKPGDGNMNFTLRIITRSRRFIVKQSRGFVEKYPDVPAPEDRVLREAEFYKRISQVDALRNRMPQLKDVDKHNRVMLLEDLGEQPDYSFLYRNGENLAEKDLETLIDFLATLHNNIKTDGHKTALPNRAMRELNCEHIFKFPYLQENGLNLDEILPGLQEIGDAIKQDKALQQKLLPLGDLYLADGQHLLHGDFFPGSFMKTANGIKIIDPEFCFFGPPEFEIGVFLAHLKMADQSEALIEKAKNLYAAKAPLDKTSTAKFCAVEVLRRILGLAQLPLEIDLNKRKKLIEEARECLVKN